MEKKLSSITKKASERIWFYPLIKVKQLITKRIQIQFHESKVKKNIYNFEIIKLYFWKQLSSFFINLIYSIFSPDIYSDLIVPVLLRTGELFVQTWRPEPLPIGFGGRSFRGWEPGPLFIIDDVTIWI